MQFGTGTAFALAIAAFAAALPALLHADALMVKTEQGKVHGKTINDGRVKAFLGLPYAAPPVGGLRWKAPQPPLPWKGQRDATRFGAHCVQGHVWDDITFQDSGESEDCLFLNVYAPAGAKANSKLPVMFWIHGGGYKAGAGSEPRHNGDFLPLHGVVLVTINYRLSAFGFLATADLAKEANGAAGNYGLLDMVAALQWVKASIANFGGNPGNVTIFGESVGASAVVALMASPAARGLFHKAIGESVGALESGLLHQDSLEDRERHDAAWVESLGVKSLAELRALPAEKILAAASVKGALRFSPVVDGRLLTEPIAATYAAGRQAHVPLLAGWNRDENTSLATEMTPEKWTAYASENFKERAAEFLSLYPGKTDEQAWRSAADYGSDAFVAFHTWRWIEAQANSGESPTWRYHFELAALPSKYHTDLAVFHSDDIEYVFGTLDTRPGETIRPEDRKLSEQMMSYWTNFAKTGDPNGPGLPVWPSYGADHSLIHLNSAISSGPDALRPRYEFLLKGMPPYPF
ncbi:MAG: carboxylesterase family protein [Terracidiphilus sp.]